MTRRKPDGSAGDADYGAIGAGYPAFRRPEPRIAALIEQALAGSHTVVNVGAGTASCESGAFTVPSCWTPRSGVVPRSVRSPRSWAPARRAPGRGDTAGSARSPSCSDRSC